MFQTHRLASIISISLSISLLTACDLEDVFDGDDDSAEEDTGTSGEPSDADSGPEGDGSGGAGGADDGPSDDGAADSGQPDGEGGEGENVDPPAAAGGEFDLILEETDLSDSKFEVEVRGAPSGADIVLVVTDASNAAPACPPSIDPVCLSIEGEVQLELNGIADEDGEAWWYVPFSAAGASGELKVQAYTETASPWFSNGLRLTVP
jgi:hypothetical protein